MNIRKVHMVYKTHLDIGFTDLAAHVMARYLDVYIPAALDTAERMRAEGGPRFVWTLGAYAIDLALRTYTGERHHRLVQAVRDREIAYHAMPYTIHSELCDQALFDAGLDIAARLDAQFGKHTVAAKMSDVPGHTRGIVGALARRGILFLHIGINDVACMAQLPPVFRWVDHKGRSVLVNYTRGYGGIVTVPGCDEALCMQNGADNAGPPSREQVRADFDKMQALYPQAEVCASTLDDFARAIADCELPEIRGEIGDTWIHGVGCDPRKTQMIRALTRLNAAWDARGAWAAHDQADTHGRTPRQRFLEQLLLVCEHTWGLDAKKFLTDFSHWSRLDFAALRARDVLLAEDGDVDGYHSMYAFAHHEFHKLHPQGVTWETRTVQGFEASHAEQRAYIDAAVADLPEPLRAEAEAALDVPLWPVPGQGSEPEQLPGDTGVALGQEPYGWVALPVYQEVGVDTYARLMTDYLEHVAENMDWAVPDNGKPGLERGDAPQTDRLHRPRLAQVWRQGERATWQGTFDDAPVNLAGCPRQVAMAIERQGEDRALMTVAWRGKAANRKPEALYWPFHVPGATGLLLHKVGEWVDVKDCVPRGNARVHGVQGVVFVRAADCVRVTPLDTPLVAVGAPALLDFDPAQDVSQVYFALYNNLWGTNFKMWYDEDFTCRFLVERLPLTHI